MLSRERAKAAQRLHFTGGRDGEMRRHGPPRRRRYARQSARVEGWHGGEGPPGQGHLTFRHSGGLALSAGAAYSQAPRAPAARRGGSRLYLTLERPHPGGKPTLPPPKTSEAPPQHRAWTILNMTARRSQRSREISHGRYAIILAANIYVLRNINETLCGCHSSDSRVLPYPPGAAADGLSPFGCQVFMRSSRRAWDR